MFSKQRLFVDKAKLSAALMIMVLALPLASCGNIVHTEVAGKVGVAVNDQEQLEILVQPCGIPINIITVSGPNIDGENEEYGEWEHSGPVSDEFSFNPLSPPAGWEGTEDFSLPTESDSMILVNAGSTKDDVETFPVDLEIGELNELEPGQIITGSLESTHPAAAREILGKEDFSTCQQD